MCSAFISVISSNCPTHAVEFMCLEQHLFQYVALLLNTKNTSTALPCCTFRRVAAPAPREAFGMAERPAAQAPPKRKGCTTGNPFARKKNKA